MISDRMHPVARLRHDHLAVNIFALVPFALVLITTGCGIVPHYATAKMADQGEWQITPALTVHTFSSTPRTTQEEGEELEASGSGISVGAAGAYGLTNTLNMAIRYEHFLNEPESRHFLHGELKIGIEQNKTALSIGYGQLLGAGIHLATLNAFLDYPLRDGFVFCLSPQSSILFIPGSAVGIFDAAMNGSLTWPVTPQLAIIPQAGISVMPLFFNVYALKFGIASRFTF